MPNLPSMGRPSRQRGPCPFVSPLDRFSGAKLVASAKAYAVFDQFRINQTFADDKKVERSLRHSIYDGMTFAAMGGMAENYFSAFALHLRASTAQIGLLASVPPLLATTTQLFSVWLSSRTNLRRSIIVGGAVLQALTLIPLALLPLWSKDAVTGLLICAVVYFIGPNLGSPQWGSLIGDLVPEDRRGRFFALRTRLSTLCGFVALVAAGLALHLFETYQLAYWGFLTIFAGACAFRFASAYHLSRMLDPPRIAAVVEDKSDRAFWRRIRHSQLVRFSLFFACMQFSVAIAGPFFVVYMLRDLQFSYFEFMVNSAMSVCIQFLTLNRWGRITDLFGNRVVLRASGVLIPFLPLLWLLSTDYFYLLFVQAASGLVWAGFSLSASNSIFELTPPQRRATLMAYHNVLAAFAVFLGASLGGYLGSHLPKEIVIAGTTYSWLSALYGGMVISGLLRGTVAALFLPYMKEQRKVRRVSMTGVIFSVTRFNPIAGVVFDLAGSFRSRDRGRES